MSKFYRLLKEETEDRFIVILKHDYHKIIPAVLNSMMMMSKGYITVIMSTVKLS